MILLLILITAGIATDFLVSLKRWFATFSLQLWTSLQRCPLCSLLVLLVFET